MADHQESRKRERGSPTPNSAKLSQHSSPKSRRNVSYSPKRDSSAPPPVVLSPTAYALLEGDQYVFIDRQDTGWGAVDQAAYYDLKSLSPDIYDFPVYRDQSSSKKTSEDDAAKWISEVFVPLEETHIKVDSFVNFCGVPPLLHSSIARPDICVEIIKNRLPLVCIEVHSGDDAKSYVNTVAKTVAVVIDQLRALRNLDSSIKEVTGYTLPKLGPKTALAKVTVTWQDLAFFVEIRVFKTVQEARHEMQLRGADSSLLLKQMAASFQIPSQSSIVAYREKGNVYLKYNPKLTMSWRSCSSAVVNAESQEFLGRVLFSVYPARKQITLEEAREIKHDFVTE